MKQSISSTSPPQASGSYGVYTAPFRMHNRRRKNRPVRAVLSLRGTSEISVEVKGTKVRASNNTKQLQNRVKRAETSRGRSRHSARAAHGRSSRGVISEIELLQAYSASKRSSEKSTPTVSLVLDPRNKNGDPVVPRSFTQQLNIRPFTKDQRTEQLRKLLVHANPVTLRRPESFHINSFFEGAAPGFRIGSASSKELDPPHRYRLRDRFKYKATLNSGKVEAKQKFATSNRSASLASLMEKFDIKKNMMKSRGAEYPIGPHVEDERLWKNYGDRLLRKTCPLQPLDPALPGVEEMPPLPRNSFFLVRHADYGKDGDSFNPNSAQSLSKLQRRMKNKLRDSRKLAQSLKLSSGSCTLVDGGPSLQEKSITGESLSLTHNITGSHELDFTRKAPLMCTRQLFGRTQRGIIVEEIEDREGNADEGSAIFTESVELLKIQDGDDELNIQKKRPSTAPSYSDSLLSPQPHNMKMTVTVRKDARQRSKSKRRHTRSGAGNREILNTIDKNGDPESLGLSKLETRTRHQADQLSEISMNEWHCIPMHIIYPESSFQEELQLVHETVLGRVNAELRSRQVCVYLMGSANHHKVSETPKWADLAITDHMLNVDICRNSICLILKGSEYGKSIPHLSSHAYDMLKHHGYDSPPRRKDTSRYDILIRHACRDMPIYKRSDPNLKQDLRSSILCYEKPQTSMGDKESAVLLQEFLSKQSKAGKLILREYSSTLNFCDILVSDILSKITPYFPKKLAISSSPEEHTPTWYRHERIKHHLTRNKHSSSGTASPSLLEGMAERLRMNTGMSPVLVIGSQGRGKSYSMAILSDFIEGAGDQWVLLSHFSNASTQSRQLCPMLARLCTELRAYCTPNNIRSCHAYQSYESLCSELHVILREVSGALSAQGKTLVVLIDSIDSLNDEAGQFKWLPTVIPVNIQFVISCKSNSDAKGFLNLKYGQLQTFDLDQDPLSHSVLQHIIESRCEQYSLDFQKGLKTDFMKACRELVRRHASANALYMQAAAWRLYRNCTQTLPEILKTVPKTLKKILTDEIHRADADLREWFVQHLFRKTGSKSVKLSLGEIAIQSHDLFASVMSALWANKTELAFDEFVQLVEHLFSVSQLSRSFGLHMNIKTHGNPASRDGKQATSPTCQLHVVSEQLAVRLLSSLGPHICANYLRNGKMGKVTLTSSAIRDSITEIYLKTPLLQAQAYGQMAAYCLKIGDPKSQGTWEMQSGTGENGKLQNCWFDAVEYIVAYQLAGHEVLGFRATLCNPWYIWARCVVVSQLPCGIDRLLRDIKNVLNALASSKYLSLHASIFDYHQDESASQIPMVSNAIMEMYQFVMYNRKRLFHLPGRTLQLALSEWMTKLTSTCVEQELHRAKVNSESSYGLNGLFRWSNKPSRPLRLTSHIGFGSSITCIGVSCSSVNILDSSYLVALGMSCGRTFVIDSFSGSTLFVLEDAAKPEIQSQTSEISQVSFARESHIIIVRQGESITLWMLPLGQVSYTLPTNLASCFSVGKSPNSTSDMIFVGNSKGYISTWKIDRSVLSPENVQLVSESFVSSSSILSTACSSVSPFVASGSDDSTIVVWQVSRGQLAEHARIRGNMNAMGPITCLKFRSDGQRIAASSVESPNVKIWDIHGSLSREICAGNNGAGIQCIEWSKDMRIIVTSSTLGNQISVWDAESSSRISSLTGHHQTIKCMAFTWIPTSEDAAMISLVTGSDDSLARFWNFAGILPGSPGHDYFHGADKASCAEIVPSVLSNASATKLRYERDVDGTYKSKTPCSDGEKHVIASTEVPESKTSEEETLISETSFLETRLHAMGVQRSALSAHDGAILCSDAWIGQSQGIIATGGVDGVIRLWSFPNQDHIASLSASNAKSYAFAISALAFSLSGNYLASWIEGENGGLYLWDVECLELKWKKTPAEFRNFNVVCLDFLENVPGAATLLVCGSHGRVCLIDSESGDQLATRVVAMSKSGNSKGSEAELIQASFNKSIISDLPQCTNIAVVDSVGVMRTYEITNLREVGSGAKLCMEQTKIVGSWAGPNRDAHVVSIIEQGNNAVCHIQVTPGGGHLKVPVMPNAECSAFSVTKSEPRWMSLGWTDGTVIFCRIIGSGSVGLLGTAMCPDAVSTLTIIHNTNTSEINFTCCDKSGNLLNFVSAQEEAIPDYLQHQAIADATSSKKYDEALSRQSLPPIANEPVTEMVPSNELIDPNKEDTSVAQTYGGPERFYNDGVDRSNIERNRFGEEEPHTDEPELWNIDGTEMDFLAKYKVGGQMWYIQSRARERASHDPPLPIAGIPMNNRATQAKRLYEA